MEVGFLRLCAFCHVKSCLACVRNTHTDTVLLLRGNRMTPVICQSDIFAIRQMQQRGKEQGRERREGDKTQRVRGHRGGEGEKDGWQKKH